jgi:GT2 family glycosyltransferase
MQINGSIVLYKDDEQVLKKAISSFLNTNLDVKLYLIDNSPNDNLSYLSKLDDRIEYFFNNKNLGFGTAHNIAMRKSIASKTKYHLVLNPDVYFKKGVLENLLNYMDNNPNIANVIPKVYTLDNILHHSCKLLPTPIDLLTRRFIPLKTLRKKINENYELHHFKYDKPLNLPNQWGCFMFLRTKHLEEIGLFDENIFMYMEDIDLNRRLHAKYKTMFFPDVSIVHLHAKKSYKVLSLFIAHIRSTIYYFNKYGWFIDDFRKEKNKNVINTID